MIGSLIGAGVSLLGGLFSGVSSARRNREVRRNIEQQKAKNDAWYERRYNEDATQRADAQRALELVSERMRKERQAARGAAAVSGATDESVALAKQASNEVLADTASQIVAQGVQDKHNIEMQHNSVDDALNSELREGANINAQQNAKAMTGALEKGTSIIAGIGDNIWERGKKK